MHRNFVTVVEPIVEALRPPVIAEVGAGRGLLTRRLIALPGCSRSEIHAIDPDPRFDPTGLARVTLHREGALAALRRIGPADVVLIDGDPNWHAVTEALRTCIDVAAEGGAPAPVIAVHQVHWPFGRRDGYFRPEALPAGACHEHSSDGLSPLSGQPVRGALDLIPHVAVREHGPRNGVLTALEDFLAAASERWVTVETPGFGGTAVLATLARIEAEPAVRALFDQLGSSAALRHVARRLESARLASAAEERPPPPPTERDDEALEALRLAAQTAEAERAALAERAPVLEADLATAEHEVQRLTREANAFVEARARHAAGEWRIESLEQDLARRETERADAVAARERLVHALAHAEAERARAETELELHRGASTEAAGARDAAEARLAETAGRMAELIEAEQVLSGRVLHLEDALEAAQRDAQEAEAERRQTGAALDEARVDAAEIAVAVRAVAGTRRSRAGRALRRGWRRATLRDDAPSALERVVRLTETPVQIAAPPARDRYREEPVLTRKEDQ